jgi:hypothetical protein
MFAAGEDVDAKFSEQYRLPPESIEFDEPEQTRYSHYDNLADARFKLLMFLICFGAVAIVGVVAVSVVKIYRSRKPSASVRR